MHIRIIIILVYVQGARLLYLLRLNLQKAHVIQKGLVSRSVTTRKTKIYYRSMHVMILIIILPKLYLEK